MTISTSTEWETLGTPRPLCGERVFTIDAPSIGPERHAPLLVLHGFPTSSFDYAAVLDGLRDGRRVLLLDMVGYGLSSKPDRAYSIALQADVAAAFVAALRIERLALLTHDMGDTVGGELLARRAEGAWAVEVTQRVLTNGSIYIDQAHLTNGQQLLLGLPDEMLPPGIPIDAASIAQSLRETFSPLTPPVPAGWPEDPVPAAAAQVVRDDGQLLLPRLIRYIEERRANERRFTGAIETDRAPLRVVWGLDDPIAVPSMVDTLLAARPDGSKGWATTPWSSRHGASWTPCCPGWAEAPHRRPSLEPAEGHRAISGAVRNLTRCRAAADPRTVTSSSRAPGPATSWSGRMPPSSRPTMHSWSARTVRCACTVACAVTAGCCRSHRPGRHASGSSSATKSGCPCAALRCGTATCCASLPWTAPSTSLCSPRWPLRS
jgi:pimeloyl-ACP methyl ester carboxylesterase